MNKRQKEVIQAQLDSEKAVLKQLEKQYQAALNDINRKIRILQSDEMTQSKIYRLEYQKALKKQVEAILEKLHSDEFSTIQEYLSASYTDAFVGTMYDLSGQGVPLILPIDQEAAVKAIMLDSKVSEGLYSALGVDVKGLKKSIAAEITRGIASGMSYADIARNISNVSKAPLSRAKTIARTEGHRIQQASTRDAQQFAKSKGADVVKQWDATLDGKTRDSHRAVDGEIRELDEKFSNGLEYPGDPNGPAAEVINCRCVSLSRARRALDADELKTLQDRAAFFGLDKTKSFEEYKEKYLQVKQKGLSAKISGDGIPEHDAPLFVKSIDYNNKKAVMEEITKFERAMVNSAIETACVITQEGKVYYCSGVKDQVFPDFDLKDEIKGATITHNHPISETVYTFSHPDLKLFMEYDLDVLRGCDKRYTYEFTRNADEIDIIDDPNIDADEMTEEIFYHFDMIHRAQERGIGYRRWKND